MNPDLSGRVAVVIGGTGSIGSEISISLFDSGAKVFSCSPKKEDALPEVKKYIDEKKISFLAVDVTDEDSIKKAAEKVGRIDILVLVQGIQKRQPFFDFTLEQWNQVLKVNLTGTFLACKHFAKPMVSQKSGKIIGITSLATEFGIRNISAYAASKGGMSQFLKTVAVELAESNVNVNMVAPGRILTKMTEGLLKDEKTKQSNLRCIPLNRFGLPSDIVGTVLFLASSAADYITGQTIFVDGGWMASMGNPKD